jgi:hypothetical protein
MPYAYRKSDSPQQSKDGALQDTYVVRDVQDAGQAVAVAFGAAPTFLQGKIREAIPDARPVGYDTFEVTFGYVDPELEGVGQPPAPPNQNTPSDAVLEFDTGGGSAHISTAIAQRKSPGAPDRFKAIGVSKNSGGDWTVEGTDIVIPDFRFSLTIQWPAQAINAAGGGDYIFGLYNLTGKTNSSPWTARGTFQGITLSLPFQASEVLFLGARGGGSGQFLPITYSFGASPNKQVTVDDEIAPAQKKGHEYLWVSFKSTENTTPPAIVQRPEFVYVAQVYEEADFQQVLGF